MQRQQGGEDQDRGEEKRNTRPVSLGQPGAKRDQTPERGGLGATPVFGARLTAARDAPARAVTDPGAGADSAESNQLSANGAS